MMGKTINKKVKSNQVIATANPNKIDEENGIKFSSLVSPNPSNKEI